MIDFEEEIKSIAIESMKLAGKEKTTTELEADDIGKEVKEAMERLLEITELGAAVYNKGLNRRELFVYKLPEEVLTLFLNLPGKRSGFCLIADERFVVFLGDEPGQLVVVGKKRESFGPGENVLTKARQLIRITFIKAKEGFVFKDNSGSVLDPGEIIVHIIKWAISK